MVSDLKTFAHKGCKITAQKKMLFGEFCLTSRIFLVSVPLSASVERCFVFRMRDFLGLLTDILKQDSSGQEAKWAKISSIYQKRKRAINVFFFFFLEIYPFCHNAVGKGQPTETVSCAYKPLVSSSGIWCQATLLN